MRVKLAKGEISKSQYSNMIIAEIFKMHTEDKIVLKKTHSLKTGLKRLKLKKEIKLKFKVLN